MKKSALVLCLFLFSVLNNSLNAQLLRVGMKGGLNFSNMLEASDFNTFSDVYKYSTGYNIGLAVSTPATSVVGGESGIYLNTRGYKINSGDDVNGVVGSVNTLWLEIPFKATKSMELGPLTLFASGGVSGSLGLSGTMDLDVTVLGLTTSSEDDIVWGTDPDDADLVRIDYGAVASAGLEFKSFVLELGYYYGLANISPYIEDGYVISSRYFSISLGYLFGL